MTAASTSKFREQAQLRNIPVNVVDDPELCSFIMPAILDRSPLMVAFSSGGASPVLTRMMRGKLETMIPQNYSRLAAFAERFREQVKQRVTDPAKRRIFWENALEGVVAEKVLTGDEEQRREDAATDAGETRTTSSAAKCIWSARVPAIPTC